MFIPGPSSPADAVRPQEAHTDRAAEHKAFRAVSQDAIAAKSLIESLRATLTEDDADLLADMVEGETSLFEAIDVLLARILETEGLVAGAAHAIHAMQCRKERFEDRIKALRSVIEQALVMAELETKIERPLATLTLAKRQPKVEVATEADIPAEFWKPSDPRLDKKALLEALKAGRPVPGAYLSNAAPTLTVRVN